MADPRRFARQILLVDDDVYVHAIVAAALAVVPAEISGARSARSAIELARTRRFDVVLLDLGLPDADGWVVLEELRRLPTTRTSPVIVVSGLVGHPLLTSSAVDAVLRKPFRTTELVAAVRRVLARGQHGETPLSA